MRGRGGWGGGFREAWGHGVGDVGGYINRCSFVFLLSCVVWIIGNLLALSFIGCGSSPSKAVSIPVVQYLRSFPGFSFYLLRYQPWSLAL